MYNKKNKLYFILKKSKVLFVSSYWEVYVLYNLIFKKSVCFGEGYFKYKGYMIRKNNWGDDLNFYLLKDVLGVKIAFVPFSKCTKHILKKHYLFIGSIISFLNLDKAVICGAGIQNPNEVLKGRPEKILFVRGPRTRQILKENGIDCPANYGDPALVLPLFYMPAIKENNKGIIVIANEGTDSFVVSEWCDSNLNDNYQILDMKNYSKWTDIIDVICNAKYVISESLHGLIISETYNIPNVWVEFIEHPNYWNFKYEDYFESIDKNENIIRLQDGDKNKVIFDKLKSWKKGNIKYKDIISYFPEEFILKNVDGKYGK